MCKTALAHTAFVPSLNYIINTMYIHVPLTIAIVDAHLGQVTRHRIEFMRDAMVRPDRLFTLAGNGISLKIILR